MPVYTSPASHNANRMALHGTAANPVSQPGTSFSDVLSAASNLSQAAAEKAPGMTMTAVAASIVTPPFKRPATSPSISAASAGSEAGQAAKAGLQAAHPGLAIPHRHAGPPQPPSAASAGAPAPGAVILPFSAVAPGAATRPEAVANARSVAARAPQAAHPASPLAGVIQGVSGTAPPTTAPVQPGSLPAAFVAATLPNPSAVAPSANTGATAALEAKSAPGSEVRTDPAPGSAPAARGQAPALPMAQALPGARDGTPEPASDALTAAMAATGHAQTGQAATGQIATGQTATGQIAIGQIATGQTGPAPAGPEMLPPEPRCHRQTDQPPARKRSSPLPAPAAAGPPRPPAPPPPHVLPPLRKTGQPGWPAARRLQPRLRRRLPGLRPADPLLPRRLPYRHCP